MFGQTWSETKTLQIFLESFCFHSPSHAFISPREALLACPPSPPLNLLSFSVESTLSSPCSRSDPPLTRQGATLTHLDSPHSRSGTLDWRLCSFSFGPRWLWRASWNHSFLFGRPSMFKFFCWSLRHSASSACLGSTNKSATSLFSLWLSLCSLLRLSFYLKLSGGSGRNCLLSPPVLSGYNGCPDTRFSWGTTQLRNWPDGNRYSCPLQSLVVSLLLSLVSTLVSSRARGMLPHRNSLPHRFLRSPLKNLCSLVMLAVPSLSSLL